jgi:hypothetical protein
MKRLVLLAGLLAGSAVPAWAASIALFSTPDCSSCNLSVPLAGLGTFYVCALARDFEPSLPDGAEFRVVGVPPGWFIRSVTPNPAAAAIVGNPLGAGVNIAFATGQPGPCLNLFTIEVIATTAVSDVVLRVAPHATPSNPAFRCPALFMDWVPYAEICVDGGEMFLNSSRDCAVGAAPTTWSKVKRLYD